MKTPNLTVIFISLTAVVVAGLAGGVVLTVVDKDATAFYGFFTATLATIVAFAGLLRSQSAISDKVEAVQHNVNGRLSQLIDIAANRTDKTEGEEARLTAIIEQTGVHPSPSLEQEGPPSHA
jgi:hypothetical protein